MAKYLFPIDKLPGGVAPEAGYIEDRVIKHGLPAPTAIGVDVVTDVGRALICEFNPALTDSEHAVLVNLVTNQGRVDDQGVPVAAASPYAYADEDALYMGMGDQEWECPPGALSIFDMVVNTVVYVRGGIFWVEGAARGSYAEFSVLDKDDVLGMHTQLGLPLGYPIELGKYAHRFSVPPVLPVWDKDIIMPTAARVLPGLYMRCHFFNASTETAYIGCTYVTFEDNNL